LGNITIGMEIPPMQHSPDFAHWNRYAAVNDEFVPIHMDEAAGREAGFESAIGMGNLQWAYLHNVLEAWAGEAGRLIALSCQFRSANARGQTVTARARVTGLQDVDGQAHVELETWTEDQNGTRVATGNATVVIGSATGVEADLQA
jgi:acyl dehydratase